MRDLALTLALAPILIPQVAWVRFRAACLQEASGPREGVAGNGPPLRLLVLGDSSAAGVGVAHQEDALIGRLVARLAQRYQVSWRLAARCGATTTTVLRNLETEPKARFDIAVIALGVNDSKNGMSRSRWQKNYKDLIMLLQRRFGVREIYATAVPPLGAFPLLPAPLRTVLGRRATLFDGDLRGIAADQDAVQYVPFDFPMDTNLMAEDGFHPGPVIYDRWAARVAEMIT
ncbi:SGNH/GDSL hydrolase family protein [Roseovarius phycicola]|uniref:SGNH/GDSL hydrolase family protein n=1 Tax=Roseovarius phycicola TaxID=3080976 RepID=A0ABZ2HJ70_9RHOB